MRLHHLHINRSGKKKKTVQHGQIPTDIYNAENETNIGTCFFFLVRKRNIIKSTKGANQVPRKYTRELPS